MSRLMAPVGQSDHVIGKPDATITLIEYGDYQCPDCGHSYPLIKKLREEISNKLRFVFRNFPLEEHPHAILAARVAEAAGYQHKFWEMHDYIYEHQEELDGNIMIDFGKRLDLNISQLEKDCNSSDVSSKIENDLESGRNSGVNGTPSFFINDKKITSYDGSYESLLTAVLSFE